MTITIIILAMVVGAILGAYAWQTILVSPHFHQRLCDLECALGRIKPGELVPAGSTTDRWSRVLRDVLRLRRGMQQ